ncbi:hypothetical protein [Caulobacter sp. UNC279MFTsu5.1]|uniref:hypothetical protein n=1 Tax=Caulobacter sp. UNC279MFTsu5.1 TaxID=1502775 RepID=UPI000403BB1B|nr:hypothetical protein [Caulobacter sp. UNC279MFTsu5.1]SFJ33088.1 hypothetical protein SAMN02799626_01568 [Caulobacter sp. UNC279MFTsu5.1]
MAFAGETVNGDNLLAIRDADVAAAFAIEALALVDHFNFLGRVADEAKKAGVAPVTPTTVAGKRTAAAEAQWFLGVRDLGLGNTSIPRIYIAATVSCFPDRRSGRSALQSRGGRSRRAARWAPRTSGS